MPLIDLILNLAALLLWLNWRAIDFAAISSPRVSIVSNLKKLNRSPSRWIFFVILLAVLLGRAVIYRQLGPALDWVAAIPLGPTTLHFRSDYFGRIFLFSFLSFGVVLGIFYLGLLFFSIVNTRISDADPLQKLIRLHMGWLERLPLFIKLFLPLLVPLCLWICVRPLLIYLNLVPETSSFRHAVEQGVVIGLNAYFIWKYYILAVLVLHVLNSYIYFGAAPVWTYIAQTGRQVMLPLSRLPLLAGRFGPLVELLCIIFAMALIFFGAKYAQWKLGVLYSNFVT
ncbi:MAG: hypothetical protein JWM68_1577 [Verrucomicrobiales bacterium]|nr:hypothetical protein [Verrucomicrobiales bacterium]